MSSNKFHEPTSRRYIAYLSILGTTQLHLRNPYIIAAWSVAFPGMGHLLLSKYLRGFVLFLWEVYINYKGHINLLILYSFIGDFEKAKQVADIRWMSLYIPTYIFAIWDSYRTTIDLNHAYILADREGGEIKPFKISAMEINYLDKRNPLVSAVWSLLVPGSGQLYLHRLITALFLVGWWIFICYDSNLLPAFHYTFLGDFTKSKNLLNMHWFLNVPSVYLFAVYDAYVNTVENNKLFDKEQSKYLKREYQKNDFLAFFNKSYRGDYMYIVSTFEHSIYLELALSELECNGINKDNILAMPLDKRHKNISLFDSIHSSDGLSLFDLPAILAVAFGIFGGIYGFVLKWGPLLWGLLAILFGFVLGLIIKLIFTWKKSHKLISEKHSEVVILIKCNKEQIESVKNILWNNNAFGVSSLSLSDS
ncbi:hypothetical protein [Clostridium manihotivorum]|uniref:Uncharacterized protein n=1 Tax=Clostridium manihotivorum TaxID=2320868 RepID=A0A410DTK2_9CLOT|nr:hypothetical protein [Clostridium manihotivorum]QAA32573.1 hypothetical protein C1I91_13530 [Clostridium manihotivorum]